MSLILHLKTRRERAGGRLVRNAIINDIIDLFWYSVVRTDIFPRESLIVTSSYVELKKSQTLPEDKYNIVNELVVLRAKHTQTMDKSTNYRQTLESVSL